MRALIDRWFPRWHLFWYRVWRGNMPGLLGKKRILLLTTTGRRSGLDRTTILLYVRDGADLVVVGSNGGAAHHPTWALNLRAQPRGEVAIGHKRWSVTATEIDNPADYDRIWRAVVAVFKGYESYRAKTHRHIPLVRLTPTE